MAQFGGLQGLGGPIDYFGMVTAPATQALNDSYRNDALEADTAARWQQTRQARDAEARRQSAYADLAAATPDQLPALRQKHPEFADVIQKEIGIQGAEHAAFANKAMGNLSIAMQSGDPNQIARAVQAGEPVWNSMQTSGNDIMQMIQSDPERAQGMLNAAYMATLPYEKQAEIGQKRDELKEDARQANMQNETTRQGQRLSYGAQMARLNHDKYVYKQSQAALKKYGDVQDMDTLALNSQIASTGVDPLTGNPATGARIKAANNWLQGNGRFNESLISGERGIEKVNDFLDKKSFEGIGRYAGRMPDATTSAEGLANRNAIEELKSGAFVQNVQTMRGLGQLSNAEGQKLQNLISVLDITQPEDVVRKQLEEIKSQYSVLQQVAVREAESMGYSSSGYDTYVSERQAQRDKQNAGATGRAPAAAIQALQSNPSLAPQFKAKYGYLP